MADTIGEGTGIGTCPGQGVDPGWVELIDMGRVAVADKDSDLFACNLCQWKAGKRQGLYRNHEQLALLRIQLFCLAR